MNSLQEILGNPPAYKSPKEAVKGYGYAVTHQVLFIDGEFWLVPQGYIYEGPYYDYAHAYKVRPSTKFAWERVNEDL